ncbi:MAG TPA: hypothetical protein VG651_07130 [Stellaceae bacterium]|nr:hypothetical protein [Stellaceae bacterium]
MSTGWYRSAAALLAAMGLAVLASCSYIPFVGKKSEGQPAAPACPIAVILRPLANTAVFRPGTGAEIRPIDVMFYGIYSDISASCQVNGATLRVSLDNVIAAERGPAAQGNDVDLTYFVSLTASDQTVLGKKSFGVRVSIPDRAKRGGVNDHVEVVFPTAGRPIADLNITAGFQESPQAIQFYKNYRGR